MTTEGNIIVNGILASCYPSVHHDVAHIGMIPIRLFPKMTEWIFGEGNESPDYVTMMEEISKWIFPEEQGWGY